MGTEVERCLALLLEASEDHSINKMKKINSDCNSSIGEAECGVECF